jgi:histone deacetylase 11
MKSRLIFSPNYDFGMMGLEKLHPFDAKKFSKAWSILLQEFGGKLSGVSSYVTAPVNEEALGVIHSKDYLASLSESKNVASVVEIPALRFVPNAVLQKGLIEPARYATAGTLLAAREALESNIVFNLGGGFHHAFFDHGEGFCFFADAAFAIETLRAENQLSRNDKVLMIDLDAHRGNGFTSFYENDKSVSIFDMYNMQVYPGLKQGDPDDFPFIIPLRSGLGSAEYLQTLKAELPLFLESNPEPVLAFYNAGTDILASDKLGGLNVDYDSVNERDQFVIDLLRERNIPTVIMTSGGYSKDSYKLVADLAAYLIRAPSSY